MALIVFIDKLTQATTFHFEGIYLSCNYRLSENDKNSGTVSCCTSYTLQNSTLSKIKIIRYCIIMVAVFVLSKLHLTKGRHMKNKQEQNTN